MPQRDVRAHRSRPSTGPAAAGAVDYHRPATAVEAIRFGDRPDTFTARRSGHAALLPDALARLPAAARARIDDVVRYRAGGMRVGLLVGTTEGQAEDVRDALGRVPSSRVDAARHPRIPDRAVSDRVDTFAPGPVAL